MGKHMSKRVTFVVTDELAAFLEQEAERRLTTVSSVTQQLLAETYLLNFDGTESAIEDADSDVSLIRDYSEKVDFDMERKHPWRVTLPDDFPWERNYDYYDTRAQAASALRRLYE